MVWAQVSTLLPCRPAPFPDEHPDSDDHPSASGRQLPLRSGPPPLAPRPPGSPQMPPQPPAGQPDRGGGAQLQVSCLHLWPPSLMLHARGVRALLAVLHWSPCETLRRRSSPLPKGGSSAAGDWPDFSGGCGVAAAGCLKPPGPASQGWGR